MKDSRDQNRESQGSRNRRKKRKEKKLERNRKKERKDTGKKRKIEVRKVVKKWEIWDEKEEVVKSEEETKKLVPTKFHK